MVLLVPLDLLVLLELPQPDKATATPKARAQIINAGLKVLLQTRMFKKDHSFQKHRP
jgi:hypothetical protein